jgi:hypothetical protein
MNHLTRSIEASLATGNAYAALATTLSLPDICGWLLDPLAGSKSRYVGWFERYVAHHYIHHIGPQRRRTVFLSGNDCYALRCAFLHEGREDISEQRARELLDSFQFTVAPQGWMVHCNLMNTKLQLQVDVFCHQFIEAVDKFHNDVSTNPEVVERMGAMLRIRDVRGNVIE